MKLTTTRLGEVEVPASASIRFEQGLPGFENLKDFVLLEVEEGLPYRWLQSVSEAEVCLLLGNPFFFYPEYEWRLPDSTQKELGLKDSSEVEVWTVITLSSDLKDATVNLLAPIILNRVERIAKQILLHDTGYHTKHPLLRPASGEPVEVGQGG